LICRSLAAATALAVLLGTGPLRAMRQGPVGTSADRAALSITFVQGDSAGTMAGSSSDAAILDLGTVVGTPGGPRSSSTVIRRQVIVRLVSTDGRPGVATLRAALQTDDRRHRVRIDGVLLSTVPRVVDANAVVGLAVRHIIEVEVPHSEPAGELLTSITWTAEIS
jgi:hypothetical protein